MRAFPSLRVSIAAFSIGFAIIGGTATSAKDRATDRSGWHKVETEPYRLNNKQDAIAFADPRLDSTATAPAGSTARRTEACIGASSGASPGTYVRTIEFVDDTTAYMGNVGPGYFPDVRDRQPLYVTHDAGASWATVVMQSGPPVTGLCALDVVKEHDRVVAIRAGGRVGGPAVLVESLDGGTTWRSRDMSAVTGMILDIRFLDRNIGFIAGASQSEEDKAHARILKTTDGGLTWRAVFDSPRAGDNNWKLAFPSARIGYATIMSYKATQAEARGYVVKTEDGGEHWHPLVVTRDHDWVPYGLSFVSETHGWVGGATGGFETMDGGETWHPVAMGLSTNKIRILPRPGGGNTVIAIGHDLYRLELPPER